MQKLFQVTVRLKEQQLPSELLHFISVISLLKATRPLYCSSIAATKTLGIVMDVTNVKF